MITMRQAIDNGYVKPVNVDASYVCFQTGSSDSRAFRSETRITKRAPIRDYGVDLYPVSELSTSVKGSPDVMLSTVTAIATAQVSPYYHQLAASLVDSDGSINLAEAWACAFPYVSCDALVDLESDVPHMLPVGQYVMNIQAPKPFDTIDPSQVAVVSTYTERGKTNNLSYISAEGWQRVGGYDDPLIGPLARSLRDFCLTNTTIGIKPIAVKFDVVRHIVEHLNDKGFQFPPPAYLSMLSVPDLIARINGTASYINTESEITQVTTTLYSHQLGATLTHRETGSDWKITMSDDDPILTCDSRQTQSVSSFVVEYTSDTTLVSAHAQYRPDAVNMCTPDLSFSPFVAAARGLVALDFINDLVDGLPNKHFIDKHSHGITSATKVSPSMTVDDLYQFALDFDHPDVGAPIDFSPVYAWANKVALLPSSLSLSFADYSAKLISLLGALKDKVNRFFTSNYSIDDNLRSLLLRDAEAMDNQIVETSLESYDSVEQASADYQSSGNSYIDFMLSEIGMYPVTAEVDVNTGAAELAAAVLNCAFELSGKDPNPEVTDIACGGKYLNTPLLRFRYTSSYEDYRYAFTEHAVLEVPPLSEYAYVYVRPQALADAEVMSSCNAAVDEICSLFNFYADADHNRLIDFVSATDVRGRTPWLTQLTRIWLRSTNPALGAAETITNLADVFSLNAAKNANTDISLLSNFTMEQVIGTNLDEWARQGIDGTIENGYRVYYTEIPMFPRFYHVGDNGPSYSWTAGVVCAVVGVAYTRSYLKKPKTRTTSFIPALLASKVTSLTEVTNSDLKHDIANSALVMTGVADMTAAVQGQLDDTGLRLDEIKQSVDGVQSGVDDVKTSLRRVPLWPRP